jgi:DNA invertase Pin-like site-specific DNA recombinase
LNYAEEIRKKLDTNSIETINAVIYARVSTDNDGQKDSCSNQVALAESYIASHPNICLIGTYVDDGISGKNDFTRPQYNEMLQQLVSGNIDLIITKALSRLNRDQLNSLHLNSLLVEHNATVLTLEDNQVHDFEDMNSDLLHSIKYAMDAQFVKQQSLNGRKTHELRCERKELSAKDCSFGYDWHRDDKSISINNAQADVVRRIFEDFVYRNETPATLQKALNNEGISMCARTISNIIKDERYIGKFYINKRTTKLGTGKIKSKRIELPKEQWVLVERPDLQIVDNELFEMAQRLRQTRRTIYEKPDKKMSQAYFQGIHKFAGKIFCPICGKPYRFGYADRKKTIAVYRMRCHSDCTNPINRVNEKDLEEVTKQALKKTIDHQNEVCATLEHILTECVEASKNNGAEIEKLKRAKCSREKQIDSLIDTLSEGGLTNAAKERIKGKINTITSEIDSLTDSINDKESNQLDDNYVSDKIQDIRTAIADLRNFTIIDRERILNYIERIELPPNGDIELLLKSGHVITIDTNNNSDFSKDEGVVKMGIQDVRYSVPEAYQMPQHLGTHPQ